ncbi:Protein LONGIFOLIA 1 [Rhynchospora pubera]|uniref:Protein LONGIFOLIA 1 n=1 Tax=Rhynchospora pubera TaxID=906938 RepID=A0AAV8D1C1_9POAL|nr:Protein LONGIFOLIA 1 [Rhynchospora pubera]
MTELHEEDDERQFAKQVGCMATLFHFFDRPHILSGSRRERFSSSSPSQITESVSPSERSEQSGPLVLPEKENLTERPPSPEPTRASLSVFKTTTTWKLKEAPRLSLDSRLRPREIRTTVNQGQDPDDNDCNRRSPSVVARLMGVDTLPTSSGPGSPAQLCRSASESRVRREPSYYRFIDSSVSNNNIDYNITNNKKVVPEPKPDLSVRVPNPNSNPTLNPHLPFHRKSSFEPVDCYPEPKRSNSGEITLYGEIERRLRKRGIDEPCKDLETLKQVLEALQLKGLLHSQPPDRQSDGRRSFSDDHVSKLQPPIVLMKPSPRPPRSPKNESPMNRGGGPRSRQNVVHPRREKVEMDRMVRRSRSPDRSEAVKSPSSPSRRRPGYNVVSPKKVGLYGSCVESPKSPHMQKHGLTSLGCGKVRPEPVAVRPGKGSREARLIVEDDTSTSVSDSSISTTSAIDFERSKLEVENSRSGRHLLERCDKLLSSIAAFTSADIADSQPSPVSVLDASFLNDESSPSPSGKRLVIPPKSPNANVWHLETNVDHLFDSDSDEPCTIGSESDDLDYLYLCEFLRESSRHGNLTKANELLRKRHQSSDATWQQRSLVYDAVKEIVERCQQVAPYDAFNGHMGPAPHMLKQHVWGELQKIREPTVNFGELVDLNDATCRAIEKDFSADLRWSNPSLEISDAVLQIERLVFKDLVADTINELTSVASPDHLTIPRRKLVF